MKISSLTVLNTREVKQVREQLEEQHGFKGELPFVFLKSNRDRLYVIHRDVEKVKTEELRIDSMGLYFATQPFEKNRKENAELRLSVEGSQIIGPKATKNILEINKEQAKAWFRGEDLEIDGKLQGFCLVKHEKDYLGSGKAGSGKLYNYLPKTRRIIPEHTPNE